MVESQVPQKIHFSSLRIRQLDFDYIVFLFEVQVAEFEAIAENVLEEIAFRDLSAVLNLIDEALLVDQHIIPSISWKLFLLYLFMCVSAIVVNQCHTQTESLLNCFEQSVCYNIEGTSNLDVKSLLEVIFSFI